MNSTMHTHTFDLDSGALCLDFANTVEWHASDHPDDKLHDYTDLIAWAEAAAILAPDRAGRCTADGAEATRKRRGRPLIAPSGCGRQFTAFSSTFQSGGRSRPKILPS